MTSAMKSLARYVEDRELSVGQLASMAAIDEKLLKAIISGNFTPSPTHRRRLAAALGVSVEEVSWEHAVPVHHLRGNGPQCGRST